MAHPKITFISKRGLIAFIAAMLIALPGTVIAGEKFITIGTGSITGVYYPAGGSICRLVQRGRTEHGIRCSVESTGGSVYNLNALRAGELDIAAAQSDWQYHAYQGTGPFLKHDEKGETVNDASGQPIADPNPDLRSLFSLHSEAFTVIVRSDSPIKTFEDIKGTRVNIGNPGSGMHATMQLLMQRKGWKKDDFKVLSELKASEQAQALCDNKIDVMIFESGHPNGAVQEVTTSCPTRILNMDEGTIKDMLSLLPYYAPATIPGGMYAGNPEDVHTFGVKATFVTSSRVDEEVIYQVVKAVFDNFDNFKTLHPVFANLEPVHLVTEGNSAPLHKGAERYFKEKGLLK